MKCKTETAETFWKKHVRQDATNSAVIHSGPCATHNRWQASALATFLIDLKSRPQIVCFGYIRKSEPRVVHSGRSKVKSQRISIAENVHNVKQEH